MTYVKTAILFACLSAAVAAWGQGAPQPKLPTTTLTAGMHVIQAEVALTPEQQTMGMMFRREMGANEGMLFVYDAPYPLCFWMRNTLIPLTIAFIADDGRIVHTADMKPRDDTSHCTTEPVRYALEMNQGWFARRGLKKGDRLRGAPFRP
jgi:uncharacterized membrane protein (UPF0127 family)